MSAKHLEEIPFRWGYINHNAMMTRFLVTESTGDLKQIATDARR